MNQFVEMRHLRYVTAVADELHFARAARRLNLAAPSLSKQIRQLEQSLGYDLFVRGTRTVSLTHAGFAFVAEAREALAHAKQAVEVGSAASKASATSLVVGYSPWLDPAFVFAARDQFLAQRPEMRVALKSEFSARQIGYLLGNQMQLGVVIPAVSPGSLKAEILRPEPLSIAVPENHHLAECSRLNVQELAQIPFVWISKAAKPALSDHLTKLCKNAGFDPHVAHEVTTTNEALALVAVGLGITFVSKRIASSLQVKGVTFRQFNKALSVDIGVACQPGRMTEAAEGFVQYLRNTVASQD